MAWQTVIIALLTLGAIARITRLLTDDTLTQPLRDYLDTQAADRWYAADESHPTVLTHALTAPRRWRYLAKLTHCPWCAGFWVAAALVLGFFRAWWGLWPWHCLPLTFAYLVAVLAASQAVGLAAEWLDSPPPVKQVQMLPAHLTVRQDPPTT